MQKFEIFMIHVKMNVIPYCFGFLTTVYEVVFILLNCNFYFWTTTIAFKGKTNICDVEIFKNKMKVMLNVKMGNLNDPLEITEDVTEKGHWGNGDYRVEMYTDEDIDNVLPLIKQSLKINKK